ncbi:Hypothetical predicted protein, partial [Paramuricea clavata]
AFLYIINLKLMRAHSLTKGRLRRNSTVIIFFRCPPLKTTQKGRCGEDLDFVTKFAPGGRKLLKPGSHYVPQLHRRHQMNIKNHPQAPFIKNIHYNLPNGGNWKVDYMIHNPDVFNGSKSDNEVLIGKARSLIKRFREESGSPGLAISVSVDGRTVWSEGFGYSDIENDVPCTPSTVMRIASISKPLTAAAAMKLLDEGKLNLDDPVQKYVPNFPEKQINSKPCVITIRQLLCHQSGIRHYHKTKKGEGSTQSGTTKNGNEKEERENKVSEFQKQEYYIKECYDSVEKSLSLFKDDPLVHEPGSEFLYTTFGWTLLSAVIESAAQKKFLLCMYELFKDLGMNNTQAELHKNLVYGRARVKRMSIKAIRFAPLGHYVRNEKGQLMNTPYVDNCYKWAGGGFISTTEDLIKFGNAMLYSSQIGEFQGKSKDSLLSGILSPESMRLSWTTVENTEDKVSKHWGYGLGWAILPEKHERGCCRDQQKAIAHSGGAVGASSILLILPNSVNKNLFDVTQESPLPNGVVVAILVNMGSVSLRRPALKIAQLFNCHQKM